MLLMVTPYHPGRGNSLEPLTRTRPTPYGRIVTLPRRGRRQIEGDAMGYVEGGHRRIDRLLQPGVLTDLTQLGNVELLILRDEALAEETEQSYVRKLVQGRLDLLRRERDRRAGRVDDALDPGFVHDDRLLVRSLAQVLAHAVAHDHPAGVSEPSVEVREWRRAPERAATDVRVSDFSHLDDDTLDSIVTRLSGFEREISESRHHVQFALDAITAEVTSRVEAGVLSSDDLPSGA
jgi:hypothetical protein